MDAYVALVVDEKDKHVDALYVHGDTVEQVRREAAFQLEARYEEYATRLKIGKVTTLMNFMQEYNIKNQTEHQRRYVMRHIWAVSRIFAMASLVVIAFGLVYGMEAVALGGVVLLLGVAAHVAYWKLRVTKTSRAYIEEKVAALT